MEFIKMQNEYAWVVDVLDSCNAIPQIEVAENLFNQYLKKWSDDISEVKKTHLTHVFSKLVKGKISEIKKNHL